MELVWSESSTQTSDMLSSFTSPSNPHPGETNETFQGLKTITINVINRICFGAERSWNEEVAISPKPGFQLTFAKSIVTIVDNLFPSVFLSAKFMSLPFMPSYMRKIGRAKTEFPLYLKDTIDSERKSPTAKNTLITSLVKLADQDSNGKMGATYLREDEIGGNLFNFTIAGFDTTANTLSYSILALALFPEWQNWMIDGIDEVTKSCPDGDYATIFPLLTRVMAIMVSGSDILKYPDVYSLHLMKLR